MTGTHPDEEPPEHRRYAAYLAALETVAREDEADLVADVLRDEDAVMAQSAVVRHLDRRAALLLTDARFSSWAAAVAPAIAGRDFLTRRLAEWTLLRTIALDGPNEPWAADELTAASDWCQRTATSTRAVASPRALALLADHGRTRRVRAAAADRLRHLGKPP